MTLIDENSAVSRSIGVSRLSRTTSKEYSADSPSVGTMRILHGTMDGPGPSRPAMPASLSMDIWPIRGPVPLSLKDALRVGTNVITDARIIGIRVSPAAMNGWPKASTRSPSMCVIVPVALTVMSPRIKPTLIMDPGSRRPPGSSRRPPPAPCRGRRPRRLNRSPNTSSVRSVNPPNETGVAIGWNWEWASGSCRGSVRGNPARSRQSSKGPTAAREPPGAFPSKPATISPIGRIPAKGSLREGKHERHSTCEPAVNVDRAAAHAGHHPGLLERAAGELPEDDR